MENRKKWKVVEIIILSLLVVIGIAAVIALVRALREYSGGESTYELLQEYVFLPEEPDAIPLAGAGGPGTGTAPAGQPEQDAEPASGSVETDGVVYYGQCPQVDFGALKKQNSDVVGWIYGPGTVINYPVVQGDDNAYYLNHMFDGKENKCGSIFMDCLSAADFSDTNSFIHGHHMKNGSMFASLAGYSRQSYYDSHPVLWLVTPEKSYLVEIFAGFVTDLENDVWQIGFSGEEEYRQWIDKMIAGSAFKSDIKPGTDDKILTLATCSYEYDDARFVVLGILRETE